MKPEQIGLVQTTFENAVYPIADTAVGLFYERLFLLDPTLRPMFPAEMQAQQQKLVAMLGVAVKNLHRPDVLIPVAQELGRRHTEYGVREEHYTTVGAALLWTLEQGLGDQWTPEVAEAWTAAYTMLSDTMNQKDESRAQEIPGRNI